MCILEAVTIINGWDYFYLSISRKAPTVPYTILYIYGTYCMCICIYIAILGGSEYIVYILYILFL